MVPYPKGGVTLVCQLTLVARETLFVRRPTRRRRARAKTGNGSVR